jgi:large subunit ribosomal protein L4
MKVTLYNQQGQEIKKIDLPEEIFGVDINTDLIHQVAVCQASNRRQGSAHTKDRSEVRGGGKKPWRQKGTGRARHGSIRSPLWKGGGVTFGPRNEKNYEKIVPKKMRQKALFMVLSGKLRDNELFFIDDIKPENEKTKSMKTIISSLPIDSGSLLILTPVKNEKIILGTRNIPKTEAMLVKNINVIDLLSFKYLLVPEESIKIIQENFSS